ncbi:Polyprotein P3 [Labeo rohita]|uniref:Polyprotein P3 n=1 Tax=Labeo rohita TaxID=84645 RepID=A0ABQ8L7Q9_LABRO|nr:Polyprotein P3 [Labeo rohita]
MVEEASRPYNNKKIFLRSVERRLLKNPEQASAYQAEITRLKEAGYVAKLDPREVDSSSESWYIPHHMVEHNNKNRVVYNCSFQFEGHSLNEFLLPGPTLGPSLLAVLLRFREHPVAVSSDIRGMFHQVRLLSGDMPLLRFLWRDLMPERPPDVYQWQVLPFGTTCSPCCATYALQRHVMDHSQPGDQLREVIERSFYVDNCLRSLHSPQEAKELVDQLCALLATGGFELRQWASNCPSAITHLPAESRSSTCDLWLSQGQQDVHESTLGLQWHCQSDSLRYKHRAKHSSPATMRQIYRVLASQYDPLGYLIPYITRAKILVQRLWDKKRDWDDPQLPKDLLTSWHEWEEELSGLEEISLPRCYSRSQKDHPFCKYDVHVFCDASEQAYGSVAYLRIEHEEGQVEVAFIAASGSQLSHLLTTELTIPINSTTLWSDSTTVLTWLTSSSCRYKVFVGTRVAEIQEMTTSAVWRYVRSLDNPADDITRGKSLRDLSEESRWSQGPTFLKLPPDSWPEQPPLPFEEPSCELRQSSFSGLVTTTTPLVKLQHYDTLAEYLNACGQELHGAAYTSSADLQRDIQQAVLRQAQAESFPDELRLLKSGKPVSSTSRLITLSPELDAVTGLIRVGGRLRHCEVLEADAVHPAVLDPRHPITALIIKDYDERLHHPGAERLFAEIRRTYWILRGREAVRRHQRQCTECRKWRGRPEVPLMADLPLTRQRYFRPAFYSTGMDCFGPYLIKIGRRNEKRWGIVFKCMTTRATHLDLLTSLDSDSFLMALRRFIARRGKPYELLCDQGTNFKGGERELNDAFAALQDELKSHLANQQIKFTYNPPSAPHFGGCWEREIRSIKAALRVTIGAQTVTEEVLRTVLIEVEGILNSKPLGYTSSDVADLDPITPYCFLIGRRDASLPQVIYQESEMLSRRRWRHSQLLAEHFWKHFLKHYLPDLQARQKWKMEKRTLEIGDVVLIIDPQLPRALWPVGRITQVFPGADGRVRTASVDVKGKTYTRIVARLIQLPALPEDD